jgi:hypothetical protein
MSLYLRNKSYPVSKRTYPTSSSSFDLTRNLLLPLIMVTSTWGCQFGDCTGSTRFCHLLWFFQRKSRVLSAMFMNSSQNLMWLSHYSCISIVGIKYWQAVHIQTLTEYTVATTKQNYNFLCSCLYRTTTRVHPSHLIPIMWYTPSTVLKPLIPLKHLAPRYHLSTMHVHHSEHLHYFSVQFSRWLPKCELGLVLMVLHLPAFSLLRFV